MVPGATVKTGLEGHGQLQRRPGPGLTRTWGPAPVEASLTEEKILEATLNHRPGKRKQLLLILDRGGG